MAEPLDKNEYEAFLTWFEEEYRKPSDTESVYKTLIKRNVPIKTYQQTPYYKFWFENIKGAKIPSTITLSSGRQARANWVPIGSGMDIKTNKPVAFMLPFLPIGVMTEDMANDLINNIMVKTKTDAGYEIYRKIQPRELTLFTPQIGKLYQTARYSSLFNQLTMRGMKPEELNIPEMQDFLVRQAKIGDFANPDYLDSLTTVAIPSLIKYYGSDQYKLDRQARQNELELYGQTGKENAETQRINTLLGQSSVSKGQQYASETDWMKATIEQLEPTYEQYKSQEEVGAFDRRLLGTPVSQAAAQVLQTYEQAQQRLTELQGGAPEAGVFGQQALDEAGARRLEEDEINARLKERSERLYLEEWQKQQKEWQKLVTVSRQPQRISKL